MNVTFRLLVWLVLMCVTEGFFVQAGEFEVLAENRRLGDSKQIRQGPASPTQKVAEYLVTVADDFVVEIYHNGQQVPDSARELILERFGATGEKVAVAVKAGDWLVFHVVANRMRWDGSKYFAVAGCITPNTFGFVSDPESPAWSACDEPGKVASFIEQRDEGMGHRARSIAQPWGEGNMFMQQFCGDAFTGKALWGEAASTWIKYVAPGQSPVDLPAIKKERPLQILQPRRWPVQVLSAVYGTQGTDADVTERVKELVEQTPQTFSASPKDLGVDPVPFWNKELRIVYMKDGVRREQSRNENEVILPESFFGPQDAPELRIWLSETRWFGRQGEVQFHPDQSFTAAGLKEPGRWETLAANRVRLTWSATEQKEFSFDYTWSSFSESSNAQDIYHLVR